ncbi:MAG: Vitamin B12 dependent methionine synthase activation subunit [Clostridia bacterium]|nr:Vitamin B12 dependent methionine synthase activation subunit [Clostridia bacterium]
MTPVFTKFYGAPPVNEAEVLRYAGLRGEAEDVTRLLRECESEAEGVLKFAVCHTVTDALFPGEDVTRRLEGCRRAVVFAATIGVGIDRLIAKYGVISPAKALLLDALGAERIEALCDLFCADLALDAGVNGLETTTRFSPGYGDFPLEYQKNVISLLDAPRRIGLTLNDSLLLSPTKSVTAVVGLK